MAKPSTRFSLLCAAIMAFGPALQADSVTLTNGEKIEGTITYESETEIVISVNISDSIKDDRSIPRSEIEEIFKVTEDSKEFATLKNYKPGSESHSLTGYETLTSALERFIGKYPESPHIPDVKANLSALREEKARVSRGDIKWTGRWFDVSQAQDVQYQYDAKKLFTQMNTRAAGGDLIGALNTFDEIEKKYFGSVAFPDAVKLALTIIPKAESEVNRLAPNHKRQQEKFKESIHLVPEPERTRLITANNATIAASEAAVTAAERAGQKWMPLAPLSDKANTSIRAMAAAEIPRLRALPIDDMRLSIALNDEIEKQINENALAKAAETLKRAQALWPANQRLAVYLAQLKEKGESNAATAAAASQDGKQEPAANAKGAKGKAKNAKRAAKADAEPKTAEAQN